MYSFLRKWTVCIVAIWDGGGMVNVWNRLKIKRWVLQENESITMQERGSLSKIEGFGAHSKDGKVLLTIPKTLAVYVENKIDIGKSPESRRPLIVETRTT